MCIRVRLITLISLFPKLHGIRAVILTLTLATIKHKQSSATPTLANLVIQGEVVVVVVVSVVFGSALIVAKTIISLTGVGISMADLQPIRLVLFSRLML